MIGLAKSTSTFSISIVLLLLALVIFSYIGVSLWLWLLYVAALLWFFQAPFWSLVIWGILAAGLFENLF